MMDDMDVVVARPPGSIPLPQDGGAGEGRDEISHSGSSTVVNSDAGGNVKNNTGKGNNSNSNNTNNNKVSSPQLGGEREEKSDRKSRKKKERRKKDRKSGERRSKTDVSIISFLLFRGFLRFCNALYSPSHFCIHMHL
jgi:hypothetical protein